MTVNEILETIFIYIELESILMVHVKRSCGPQTIKLLMSDRLKSATGLESLGQNDDPF